MFSAEVSDHGRQLITCDSSGKTRIWNFQNGEYAVKTIIEHPFNASVYFSDTRPEQQRVATAGGWTGLQDPLNRRGAAILWDQENDALLAPPLLHDAIIRRVWFDSTGEKLLTASDDHTARLWKIQMSDLATEDAQRVANLYGRSLGLANGQLQAWKGSEQVIQFEFLSEKYPDLFRCDANEIQQWQAHAARVNSWGSNRQDGPGAAPQ